VQFPLAEVTQKVIAMNVTQPCPNPRQAALWNGQSGQAWIGAQRLLDTMFQPFEDRLLASVQAAGARRVLDVGCGTGSTTLAIARQLGASGQGTGIDISESMIAAARRRARAEGSAARFIGGDAQTTGFEPGSFDMIVSRFGIMFFDDPVAAFANLRCSASAGSELCLTAWRGPEHNAFMTTAERAAAPWLPSLPVRQPDAPGQFAFADRHRVAGILRQSGWTDIDIQPLDEECRFPESALIQYFTRLGAVGLALNEVGSALRARIIDRVREAFDPYVNGAEVRYTVACWMVRARVPGNTAKIGGHVDE
jgi:SAM-dependent methyltransferase